MPRSRSRRWSSRSHPRGRGGRFVRSTSRRSRRTTGRARRRTGAPRRRRATVGLRLFGRGEMARGLYPAAPPRVFHGGTAFRFPSVSLSVSRDPYARGKSQAFQVCATQGKATKCASGRNPRAAAAAALRSIAAALSARKGAFAALGGWGRRRRARR